MSSARTYNIDLCFVWTIIRAKSYYLERERIFLELASQMTIDIDTPTYDVTWKDELKTMAKPIIYDIMTELKRMKVP
jgi:hypothetical protein